MSNWLVQAMKASLKGKTGNRKSRRAYKSGNNAKANYYRDRKNARLAERK